MKAVIFDMDGVVIDSESIWFESRKNFLGKRGIHITPETDVNKKGVSQRDGMLFLKKYYNLKGIVDELVEERLDNLLEFYEMGQIPLMQGVLSLIKEIRKNKLKTAIASSSPLRIIEFVMKKLSLENYFDVIVSSDFVSRGKPAPDIFLYTAKKLETRPEECVVIEDSENGVKSAKAAGMKCIGLDVDGGDIRVESLKEIDFDLINSL